MTGPFEAPLDLGGETVRRDWIDYNGHMNVAYYVLAFDHAVDRLFDRLGLGIDYAEREKRALFVLENHVTYRRELAENDSMRFTGQLLDRDAKRLHAFLALHRTNGGANNSDDDNGDGGLSATYEFIALHVDYATRKSAPFPDRQMAALDAMMDSHRTLPRPEMAGHVIGIHR